MIRVSVALFAYGGIAAECLTSHIDLVAGIMKHQLPWKLFAIREDALISRSRCRATGKFLADETDVLVMLDHDIEFKPGDIMHLAELAHREQAIVGVPYSKRALARGSACRPSALPVGTNELLQIDYVASGFMGIPRGALQKILDKCYNTSWPHRVEACKDEISDFPSVWQPFVLNKEYLSEDYAFCERAKHAGVPVYAWTLPILKHWGSFGYTLEPAPVQKSMEMSGNACIIPPTSQVVLADGNSQAAHEEVASADKDRRRDLRWCGYCGDGTHDGSECPEAKADDA